MDSITRSIKVHELFELEALAGSQIVAGASGLSNEVKSVTVAEVPDAANWLIGGELVVTTGYFYRDNVDALCHWVKSLIDHQAAALAIKPLRFLGGTREELKHLADRHAFPLIELPPDIVWPTIIQSVAEKLQAHRYHVIRRAEEIHRRLTDLVLSGGGMEGIANTLAELLDNPVILEDRYLNVLAIGLPEQRRANDAKVYLEVRFSGSYIGEMKKLVSRKTKVSSHLRNHFALPIHPEGFPAVNQQILPIIANQEIYGYISTLEIWRTLDEIDILALEHGSTTIALNLIRERITLDSLQRAKTSILSRLLNNETSAETVSSIRSLVNYGLLDYNILEPSVVQLIEVDPINWQEPDHHMDESDEHAITRSAQETYRQLGLTCLSVIHHGRCVVFFRCPPEQRPSQFLDLLKNAGEELLTRLHAVHPHHRTIIGIAEPYADISGLKAAFHQADNTVRLTRKFMVGNCVVRYRDLGVLRVLSLLDEKGCRSEVEEICEEMIGKLVEHDRRHNGRLCETLDVFLNNNANLSETARALFIHPNTLNYRLKKIGRLLETDLNRADVRLNLFLALAIRKFFASE